MLFLASSAAEPYLLRPTKADLGHTASPPAPAPAPAAHKAPRAGLGGRGLGGPRDSERNRPDRHSPRIERLLAGADKGFFGELFRKINNGTAFGGAGSKLDLSRLVVSGYSVGAQMSSWFFQLQATKQLEGSATANLKNNPVRSLFENGMWANNHDKP